MNSLVQILVLKSCTLGIEKGHFVEAYSSWQPDQCSARRKERCISDGSARSWGSCIAKGPGSMYSSHGKLLLC